jgi:hypothetical protein
VKPIVTFEALVEPSQQDHVLKCLNKHPDMSIKIDSQDCCFLRQTASISAWTDADFTPSLKRLEGLCRPKSHISLSVVPLINFSSLAESSILAQKGQFDETCSQLLANQNLKTALNVKLDTSQLDKTTSE